MNSKHLWVALGVGSAAGLITALLYRPENRDRLSKAFRAVQEEAGEYLQDATDFVEDQANRLAREAQTSYQATPALAGGTTALGTLAEAVSSVVDASGDAKAKTAMKVINKVRSMV